MDLDEAIEWLQFNCHFTLDYVTTVEETDAQTEMIEVLLEAYFYTEEIEDEECEDDLEEKMGSTFGIISTGILDVQSKPTIGQYIIDKLGEP